jgi:DnaK suppressor protein
MTTDVNSTTPWLDQLRQRLSNDLDVQRTHLRQLTAGTGDPGEAHTRDALISAARLSVEQITDALHRIDQGGYGDCSRCGNGIPRERLEALPHARYCVPCQQRVGA